MSQTNPPNPHSKTPPPSLLKPLTHLHTTIASKLNSNNETIAPLFVAPPSSTTDEEEETDRVLELGCGHIVLDKNGGALGSGSFGVNSIFRNLSNFEAIECVICRKGGMVGRKGFGR